MAREVTMRKGPMPSPSFRLADDEPEADAQANSSSAAVPPPAPSMPLASPDDATPGPGSPPVPPDDGPRPPPERPTPTSAPGSSLPPESPRVVELRSRFERVHRQLDEERERLPDLAAAVATARTAAREREVQRVLESTPETIAAAEEARELLQRAIEAETTALHSAETLGVAHARARAELEAAVQAAARGDERRVLAALNATADQDAADLRRALDRLFLRARLRGLHAGASALLSATLGLAVSGEAMIERSRTLYRQIVKETPA